MIKKRPVTKKFEVKDEELEKSIEDLEMSVKMSKVYAPVHTLSYSEEVVKVESKDEEEVTTITTSMTTLPEIKESIHDRYRKYINMVNNGYLRDLSYEDAMVMLRWMERKINHNIPMNYSCGNCMFDLVKMFKNME